MGEAPGPTRSPGRRIILLTQFFDPEPTIKGLAFAKRLQELGNSVEVVTGFPNYPGGKTYSGYRQRVLQREDLEGVQVVRLPIFPSHNASAIQRALTYVSFAASALVYLLFCAKRAQAIYVYHPPLTVGMAGTVASKLRRIPMILDIQDLWPDSLRATGMATSPRLLDAIGRGCRWVYRHCARIVVLSPGFRRVLMERGVPGEKIEVIYNWAASEPSGASSGKPAAMETKGFTVLFAGNMGRAQGLDNLIASAELLRDEDIEILLLGDGVELPSLKQLVSDRGLEKVRFLPRVSFEKARDYLATADCLLVHLRADPLFDVTIPSKTQSYMSVGRPMILVGRGDAAALVEDSGCGFTVAPGKPEALAAAISRMASLSTAERQAMGNAGRAFYRQHLSFDLAVRRFDKVMAEAISSQPSNRRR
jgi:glycosyltransferase involved in cell wall biosynthesis